MQSNRLGNSVRTIALCGVCAALSIVFGKFLQIPIGNSLRISLENLPLIFLSLTLGGVLGAAVAVTADLVGCFLVGFAINPVITLGAALVGWLPSLFKKKGKTGFFSLCSAVLLTHFVASVLVKSVGLWWYFETPISVLALRAPIYLFTGLCESAVLFQLLKTPIAKSIRNGERP